jgi:hypothetical protein
VSTCSSPVAQSTLLEYWLGELSAEAEAGVEEHFIGCAYCSAQLGELVALGNGIRALVPRGAAPLFVTQPLLDDLRGDGARVREYRLSPGESVQCTVHADDDLVVSRLRAPLAGVTRLDLVRIADDGEFRLPDIPFDAAAGEVIFCPPMELLRGLGACTERLRLVAVSERGERPIADYAFHHQPSNQR